jgi:hypothetical protein
MTTSNTLFDPNKVIQTLFDGKRPNLDEKREKQINNSCRVLYALALKIKESNDRCDKKYICLRLLGNDPSLEITPKDLKSIDTLKKTFAKTNIIKEAEIKPTIIKFISKIALRSLRIFITETLADFYVFIRNQELTILQKSFEKGYNVLRAQLLLEHQAVYQYEGNKDLCLLSGYATLSLQE